MIVISPLTPANSTDGLEFVFRRCTDDPFQDEDPIEAPPNLVYGVYLGERLERLGQGVSKIPRAFLPGAILDLIVWLLLVRLLCFLSW